MADEYGRKEGAKTSLELGKRPVRRRGATAQAQSSNKAHGSRS